MAIFKGAGVAIVTPMKENLEVNYEKLEELVDSQIQQGGLRVSVLSSAGQWFGMTYREDREAVAQALRRLHESGEYPESLRD